MLFFKETGQKERDAFKDLLKTKSVYKVSFFAVWNTADWSFQGAGGGVYYSYLTTDLQEAQGMQVRWTECIQQGLHSLQGRNFSSAQGKFLTVLNLTRKMSEEIVGASADRPDEAKVEMRTYEASREGSEVSLSLAIHDNYIGDFVADGGEERDVYGFQPKDVVMSSKDGWAHPVPVGEKGTVLSLDHEGFGTYGNLWTVQELKYFENLKLWCVKVEGGQGWYPAMKFQMATPHHLS